MKQITIQNLDKELDEKIYTYLKENKNPKINEIENYFNDYIENKCVLGFDIYQYSQYPTLQQSLIPHLFKKLYDTTINNCLELDPNFFKEREKKDFIEYFIDSGDGGFQIFNNPFEAIIFAIYFQASIVRYNSNNDGTTALYNIIGEINLRYSLTFDKLYYYNKNYYGPAIINCARIMSKDKLNRFLLDKNAIIWFNQNINGIENLQSLTVEDIEETNIFGKFDIENFYSKKDTKKKIKEKKSKINIINPEEQQQNGEEETEEQEINHSLLFYRKKPGKEKDSYTIIKSDILRIGEIKSKLDILSIYNFHMQFILTSEGKSLKKYTISLGNLNSSGLSE